MGTQTEPAVSRFVLVLGFCALAALVPIWTVDFLPMVDLPQHAAQIRLWQHFEEYRATHELNIFTPYLTVYALGRLLAAVFPITTAMHVLVSLLVLALPAALCFALPRVGGERWWALLGFPLSFSFCFYWGLLNFMAAVPLAVVMVTLGFEFARAPSLRRGLGLALLGILLFLTHGLVCALTLAICGAMVLFLARSPGAALLAQLPFVPPAVVGVVWFALTRSKEAQTSKPLSWDFSWERVVDLPGVILGEAQGWEAAIFSLVMVALVALGKSKSAATTRERCARWIPFGFALAAYLFGPDIYFRAAFFNVRFAAFLLPFLLFAAAPHGRRWMVTVLALAWPLYLLPHFLGFDRETRGIDDLIAVMEPDRRVLGLVFEPFSAEVPAPAHLHQHAWYQAEKGGIADFSFAYFYVQLVRYRPDAVVPLVPDSFSWRPESFDAKLGARYDYFIVRSSRDRGRELFGAPVEPRLCSGDWWLYSPNTPNP